MALDISVQPHPCGALVRGIDLTQPLSEAESAEVRAAWLKHQVLAFPDQPMTVDDLERFAAMPDLVRLMVAHEKVAHGGDAPAALRQAMTYLG